MKLRRLRLTAAEIAETLTLPLSTVSGILTRLGLGRLGRARTDPLRADRRLIFLRFTATLVTEPAPGEPVAPAWVLGRQLPGPLPHGVVAVAAKPGLVALCPAVLPGDLSRPALRQSKPVDQHRHGLASARRPHPVFLRALLQRLVLERLIRDDPLQPRVLPLQLPEPRRVVGLQAAVLEPPSVCSCAPTPQAASPRMLDTRRRPDRVCQIRMVAELLRGLPFLSRAPRRRSAPARGSQTPFRTRFWGWCA